MKRSGSTWFNIIHSLVAEWFQIWRKSQRCLDMEMVILSTKLFSPPIFFNFFQRKSLEHSIYATKKSSSIQSSGYSRVQSKERFQQVPKSKIKMTGKNSKFSWTANKTKFSLKKLQENRQHFSPEKQNRDKKRDLMVRRCLDWNLFVFSWIKNLKLKETTEQSR